MTTTISAMTAADTSLTRDEIKLLLLGLRARRTECEQTIFACTAKPSVRRDPAYQRYVDEMEQEIHSIMDMQDRLRELRARLLRGAE